ncbi:MAG: hypothetical protein ABUL54_10765 [Dongia sp.]
MKKPAPRTKRPSTVKRPAKKMPGAREKDRQLSDRYAAEGRKDELLKGDELSELEPVGRKERK